MKWKNPNNEKAEWLLKAPFWLVAAKILQDKRVPSFIQLDLEDIDLVFSRLARHYNSANPQPIQTFKNRHSALKQTAKSVKNFAFLGNISTEALGHVFEHTLVSKATRKELGTHRTPSWLIDYMIGRMRPWIAEQSANERRIFEPACGHAGFLLAGLRLLEELRPPNHKEPRRDYLRKRLSGIEIDPFAREIARLTLTLGDVPNPNGWRLEQGDMFEGNSLTQSIQNSTVVFANPPFERFKGELQVDQLHMKAEELLRLIVKELPKGSCFGLVLPQRVLHSKQLTETRRVLLNEFEIDEATLFADKVFTAGEPETVALIARRKKAQPTSKIRYQRVRESQVAIFERTTAPSSCVYTQQNSFLGTDTNSLLLPELQELWEYLSKNESLDHYCDIGQGFQHHPRKKIAAETILSSDRKIKGFFKGFLKSDKSQFTHKLPSESWVNLDPKTISVSRKGTLTGCPQIVLNYSPVSRGPWSIKALIDIEGHAVTSSFTVIRPKNKLSLQTLWALCNSPISNAKLATISSKRHVLVGNVKKIPIPKDADWAELEELVSNYFKDAKHFDRLLERYSENESSPLLINSRSKLMPTREELDQLRSNLSHQHWRIDAAVLSLYDLPEKLEGQLLRYFTTSRCYDAKRRGVPFNQTEYFPEHFKDLNRLSDLLKITADWEKTSERKSELIDLKIEKRATKEELKELEKLKLLTEARGEYFEPIQFDHLEQIKKQLIAKVEWLGE
ncbi:MAG: HsdM family class I SAM-dependent methyltransferase [Opitutaceae bacterium]